MPAGQLPSGAVRPHFRPQGPVGAAVRPRLSRKEKYLSNETMEKANAAAYICGLELGRAKAESLDSGCQVIGEVVMNVIEEVAQF